MPYAMAAAVSPSVTATVMAKRPYTLYTNAAVEPSATSVSILGALCSSELKPEIKNFWLMTMMTTASRSCVSPTASVLPS